MKQFDASIQGQDLTSPKKAGEINCRVDLELGGLLDVILILAVCTGLDLPLWR